MRLIRFKFLFFIIFGVVYSLEEECKNQSELYKLHLGSKTPYRLVANTTTEKLNYPGCVPKKLWMIVRHGTRTPKASFILFMKRRLPEIRDLILKHNPEPSERLRNSDLYAFRKWKVKVDEKKEKYLTHEGEDEMIDLAERMQIRFPDLLPPVYSNTSYYFKYTASQRTQASARFFAAGLFGRQVVRDIVYPKPSRKDPILRFYKLCSSWINEVKKNPESSEQNGLFSNSTYMLKAVEVLNKELKLQDDNKLSLVDAELMYTTCAFETAWSRKTKSPWCSALPLEVFKVMEFAEDLKYYYKQGYGYPITYKQACVIFNDMIDNFQSESEYPKATVYYTHSGTLVKTIAQLGLYNDSKAPTQEDYGNSDRKWKVSKIDSFGTNIALVLYKCDEKYKVLTLHQEHIVRLPSCEEDLCDLDQIKEYYSDSINNCEFDKMCKNENDDT